MAKSFREQFNDFLFGPTKPKEEKKEEPEEECFWDNRKSIKSGSLKYRIVNKIKRDSHCYKHKKGLEEILEETDKYIKPSQFKIKLSKELKKGSTPIYKKEAIRYLFKNF